MPAKTQTKSRFYIGQTIIETRDTIKNKIDATHINNGTKVYAHILDTSFSISIIKVFIL